MESALDSNESDRVPTPGAELTRREFLHGAAASAAGLALGGRAGWRAARSGATTGTR
jgi:hypothetical protein